MRNEELNIKYQALLLENNQLKEEIKKLKASLGEQMPPDLTDSVSISQDKNELNSGERIPSRLNRDGVSEQDTKKSLTESDSPQLAAGSFNFKAKTEQNIGSLFPINKKSDTKEKVRLFMSLFKGREDVYAKRWENSKKGKSGYSPACAHEWQTGICLKPAITCSECKNKDFLALNEEVIEDHLRGRHNLVVGIYPMLMNETCNFLAIDSTMKVGNRIRRPFVKCVPCSIFPLPLNDPGQGTVHTPGFSLINPFLQYWQENSEVLW